MEDFGKLLEAYLDYQTIELKKSMDEKDDNNIQKSKTSSPFSKDDSISIDRFVKEYLGYDMDCATLYHSGLKELKLDYVIGISNDFANDNVEYVKKGYLLLVLDARGNRGTYMNPIYIKKYLEKDDIVEKYKMFTKLQEINLSKINLYYTKYLVALEEFDALDKFMKVAKESRSINKLENMRKGK